MISATVYIEDVADVEVSAFPSKRLLFADIDLKSHTNTLTIRVRTMADIERLEEAVAKLREQFSAVLVEREDDNG